MTIWEPSWLEPVLAEKFALFRVLTVVNSYFCHTDFALAGICATGHMLKVIVIEKDTLATILFLSKFIAYFINLFQLVLIYWEIIPSISHAIVSC